MDLCDKQPKDDLSFDKMFPSENSKIDDDDAKMENLAYLQYKAGGEAEFDSIEEKYEQKFRIEKVVKMLGDVFGKESSTDQTENFFYREEDSNRPFYTLILLAYQYRTE